MKKFMTGLACAALSVTMIAAAGCGNNGGNNKGVISGDYKEASAEDLSSAIESIDGEQVFGEGLGLKISSGFESSLSYGENSFKGRSDLSYVLIAEKDSGIISSGTASLSGSYKYEQDGVLHQDKLDYRAEICSDFDYFYLSLQDGDKTIKYKANYKEIAKAVIGSIGLPFAAAAHSAAALPASWDIHSSITLPSIDCSTLIGLIKDFNIDVGLDVSNGLKFKFSVTEETVWTIIAMSGEVTEKEIAEIKDAVTFNTFIFDAYLAFDREGAFAKASVDVNVDLTVTKALTGDNDFNFKIKGYERYTAYAGKVPLPDGVTNDKDYIDATDYIITYLGGLPGYGVTNVTGKTYTFSELEDVEPKYSFLDDYEVENAFYSQMYVNHGRYITFNKDGSCTDTYYYKQETFYYVQENGIVYIFDSPQHEYPIYCYYIDGDRLTASDTDYDTIDFTLVFTQVQNSP